MNSWNFLTNVASGVFYLGVLYLLYYISNKRQQTWNKLSANNKIQSSMNTKYFVIFSLIIAIVVFIVLLIMDKNKKQQKRRKLK